MKISLAYNFEPELSGTYTVKYVHALQGPFTLLTGLKGHLLCAAVSYKIFLGIKIIFCVGPHNFHKIK